MHSVGRPGFIYNDRIIIDVMTTVSMLELVMGQIKIIKRTLDEVTDLSQLDSVSDRATNFNLQI